MSLFLCGYTDKLNEFSRDFNEDDFKRGFKWKFVSLPSVGG